MLRVYTKGENPCICLSGEIIHDQHAQPEGINTLNPSSL